MASVKMEASKRQNFLLDTARSLLIAEGFSGITLDKVAQASGVSRALLYKYFGGLSGLVTALVDRETALALDALYEVLTSGKAATGSAEDTAEAILIAMIEATARAPLCWSMLLAPPPDGPPELYERIALGRTMARSGVEHVVRTRFELTRDVELTSRLLHTGLEELLRLHLLDPATYPVERLAYQARLSVSAALLTGGTAERIGK